MELLHIDPTVLVCISHTDELSELFLCELDIKHGKNHFKLHVVKDTVTVCIESSKCLLDINTLLLKLVLQVIPECLELGSSVLSSLLILFYCVAIMNDSGAC